MPKSAHPTPPDPDRRPRDACPEAVDLAAWVEDRLSDHERSLIDVHIARCANCSTLVADLAPSAVAVGAPEAVSASLLHSVESLVAPPLPFRFVRWCVRATAAAAAIAVVWLGYSMGGTFSTSGSTATDTGPNERTLASSDALTFGLLGDGTRKDQSDALDVATRSLLLEVIQ